MSFSKSAGMLLLLILSCAGGLAAQDPCSPFPPPPTPVSITLDQSEVVGFAMIHGLVGVSDPCSVGGIINVFGNPSVGQVITTTLTPGATSMEFFFSVGNITPQPITVVVTAASMFRFPHPVVQVSTSLTIQPLIPTITFDRAEATDGDFILATITLNDNEGAFIGLETSHPAFLAPIGSENSLFKIDGSSGTVLFQVGEVEQPTPVTVTAVITDASFFRRGATASTTLTVCPPAGCSPEPSLRIRAAIGNGSLEPPQGVISPQSAPANAHFPLGSSFRIAAFDENGNPVSSAFSLQAATVEAGVEPGALFPGLVALKYTTTQPNEATFQALHRGTVNLQVVPDDPNIEPALLNIVVEEPVSLGATHTAFDALVLTFAHKRGIPPHFIKGQIERESGFNARSWRYEPIASDGDLGQVSRGRTPPLREIAPFSSYRLATALDDGALSQGDMLLPADIAPRGHGQFPLMVRDPPQDNLGH